MRIEECNRFQRNSLRAADAFGEGASRSGDQMRRKAHLAIGAG